MNNLYYCHICQRDIHPSIQDIHTTMCNDHHSWQSDNIQPDTNLVPCTNCGIMVLFQLYQFHVNECLSNNKLCQKCQEQFPEWLVEDHKQVCTSNKNKQSSIKPPIKQPIKLNNRRSIYNYKKSKPSQIKQQQFYDINNQQVDPRDQFAMNVSRLAFNSIPQEKEPITGLTKTEIRRALKIPKISLSGKMECSICYAKLRSAIDSAALKCDHTFHKVCIEPWLLTKPNCPVCRNHVLNK